MNPDETITALREHSNAHVRITGHLIPKNTYLTGKAVTEFALGSYTVNAQYGPCAAAHTARALADAIDASIPELNQDAQPMDRARIAVWVTGLAGPWFLHRLSFDGVEFVGEVTDW